MTWPASGSVISALAKQHEHSVEVMLRMYAAWPDGATEIDIHAITQAMERKPTLHAAILESRAAISSANAATNRALQIVIRPPLIPQNLDVVWQ